MTTKQIVQTFNWDSVFGNSSQRDNLCDFLKNNINVKEFALGFYPRSKNRKLSKHLTVRKTKYFKFHAKKIWNMSNVGNFSDGGEKLRRDEYIFNLI